jgi:hypothetical protein
VKYSRKSDDTEPVNFWQLREKDVVKLGKKQYRVLQICSLDSGSNQPFEKPHYESFGSLIESHYDS